MPPPCHIMYLYNFLQQYCIGSAFNAKGAMQCPNCRQVEGGQWLFSSGCYLQQPPLRNTTSDEEYTYTGMLYNLYRYDEPWRQLIMKRWSQRAGVIAFLASAGRRGNFNRFIAKDADNQALPVSWWEKVGGLNPSSDFSFVSALTRGESTHKEVSSSGVERL
ncbi:hypothetical protein L7F22_015902 [Adiantum nelumboides]|nr:hypothetical protein [Adiantum nelumboides]